MALKDIAFETAGISPQDYGPYHTCVVQGAGFHANQNRLAYTLDVVAISSLLLFLFALSINNSRPSLVPQFRSLITIEQSSSLWSSLAQFGEHSSCGAIGQRAVLINMERCGGCEFEPHQEQSFSSLFYRTAKWLKKYRLLLLSNVFHMATWQIFILELTLGLIYLSQWRMA